MRTYRVKIIVDRSSKCLSCISALVRKQGQEALWFKKNYKYNISATYNKTLRITKQRQQHKQQQQQHKQKQNKKYYSSVLAWV